MVGGGREGSVLGALEVPETRLHPGLLGVRTQLLLLFGDQAAGRKAALGHSAGAAGCLHQALLAAASCAMSPAMSPTPSRTHTPLPRALPRPWQPEPAAVVGTHITPGWVQRLLVT